MCSLEPHRQQDLVTKVLAMKKTFRFEFLNFFSVPRYVTNFLFVLFKEFQLLFHNQELVL